MPRLCGDGFLIAGDSSMMFNALHREGSNLAMTSGRLAAETILEAIERNDFSSRGLQGYVKRLQDSYVLKDLEKYRKFPSFLGNPQGTVRLSSPCSMRRCPGNAHSRRGP